MACPYKEEESSSTEEDSKILTYSTYLKVPDLLSCVAPQTDEHDEHLFIITHQVYELWFKQILVEIDSVRHIFSKPFVDEREMLKVNSRLRRIVNIFTILVDQISVLETMAPLDFVAFRGRLGTSSVFQSSQFRLIENKIGVKFTKEAIFGNEPDQVLQINQSETEKSLADLVATWLEHTPGLETENFDFWKEFIGACHRWFTEENDKAEKESDLTKREKILESCKSQEEKFKQIFVKEKYEELLARGDRSFSWAAFKGALNVYYNRDKVLYHQPFQMLTLLMDIDVLMAKWRSAHGLLIQRMIGSKAGSGGSSDYFYLSSTVKDKCRPFVDLFQLSNYLIPKNYVNELQLTLSMAGVNSG